MIKLRGNSPSGWNFSIFCHISYFSLIVFIICLLLLCFCQKGFWVSKRLIYSTGSPKNRLEFSQSWAERASSSISSISARKRAVMGRYLGMFRLPR